MKKSNTVFLWVKALRAPFFSVTVMSAIIASLLAFKDGDFNWIYLIGSVAIIATANGGINLINDYFDIKTDNINKSYTPFSGGSRVIQKNLIGHKKILIAGLASFSASAIIGIYFVVTRDHNLIWFGLAGIGLGYFYTAPPFKFLYRGLGEIIIFLLVGPISVCGTYYLFSQSFSLESLLISFPHGILTAGVLFINEFPDYQADKKSDKRQLVVILGRKKSRHLYLAMIAIAYLSIIIPAILKLIPIFLLIILLSAPIALRAIITTYKNYNKEKKMLPAQAYTILITLINGLLISAGLALEKFF